jgi:hypothetical protein
VEIGLSFFRTEADVPRASSEFYITFLTSPRLIDLCPKKESTAMIFQPQEQYMITTSLRFLMSFALALVLGMAQAADPKEAAEPAVKKSDTGICHDKTSASYGNTKKFTAFKTLDECVKSGGTLPAKTAAAAEPVVKKSDSGICHDKTSPSYERTKKFTEFKTVDECVKSGGKLPGAK